MLRLLAIAIPVALLTACAAQAPVAPPQDSIAPVTTTAVVPERPFPHDSLYALLVAEFALRRGAYDVALEQYRAQAPALRDPAVSAHTTRLTQYLHRDEATLEAAELWVELAPDDMEARNSLARQLVASGRGAEALPHLAEIERHGHGANFPLVLTNFERLTNVQRTALAADVDRLAREFPDNTSLLFTQALLLHEMTQDDQALRKLDRLFSLEPEQVQALLLEGRILSAQGKANPYARIEKVLKENPDDNALRLRYARLLATSDMAAARDQFELLWAQAPEDTDLLYSLALINREIGDNATASVYLRKMLQLGQQVNAAQYYLGRIEEDNHNPDAALDHYQAVGPGQEYLAAGSRIGHILVDSGQLERANAWFTVQRDSYPEQREPLIGLQAELLNTAGYREDAMALLDTALEQTPEATTLLYSRAMLREQHDDLTAMETDLRAILALDADNATALNALGYTLANRTRRFAEALELVSRALALEPDEPAILDSMGWVLYRQGDLEQAAVYLRRALDLSQDDEIAAHLGEVLWVSGRQADAKTVWRQALGHAPDSDKIRAVVQRLQAGLQ
ncbi:MAG: tetratricopeptide repeat protein [Halioglobus sp.]|nr:tetratricopeptide repeat protein [Halioglobus sp.]